jgi:hypothetical protein
MKTGISFFVILLFVFICKSFTSEKVIEIYNNPIDKVLGEKWSEKKCVRKANFSAILNKKAADLNRSSEVYSIKKIQPNYYFLRHKKKFAESKTYSLIVKTKKNKIVDYTAINDYHLFNVIFYKEKLYYIADDFREGSLIERPNYGYVIGCLDKRLNDKWRLEQKSKILPFEAASFTIKKDTIYTEINTIVGCSICYKIIQHRIGLNGKIISLTDVGGNNSQAEIPINVMISNLQLKNLNKN